MMWGITLSFLPFFAAQVASHENTVECHKFHDFPPVKNTSPSSLADLKVGLVTVGKRYMMNISWAINIDASIKHLTGTLIKISGESAYLCTYSPPLAEADLSESEQKWFHNLVRASYGSITIQAANLPLPQLGSGLSYKFFTITIPRKKERIIPTTTQVPIGETPQDSPTKSEENVYSTNSTSIVVAIFGGLASLMTLGCCCMIYTNCGDNFATSLGFKELPTSHMVPVPVLLVYPAENLAFQQAVVALAEFLQWHGGCSVAVDMWQQGKIAALGPIRWLAEQAKAADRVLIVSPQTFLQPSNSPPNQSHPEPSIPAAAYDLYSLILNMVASHAKSASNLSKFWVVQLGKEQAKRPINLQLELRACKTFCLMKDLIKLCRSLHSQKQDGKKILEPIFIPGIDRSTVKLREAVEKLGEHKPSIFREVEPLKSVLTTI